MKRSAVLLFIYMSVSYMFALSAVYLTESNVVKAAANAWSLIIFLVLVYRASQFPLDLPNQLIFPLGAMYLGMFFGFFINGVQQDLAVFIKLLLCPLYVLLGYIFSGVLFNEKEFKKSIFPLFLLLAIPLILIIKDVISGYDLSGTASLGLFANRNNAALYMISLLALFLCIKQSKLYLVVLSLLVGLMFGTLGVFLAVLGSLVFSLADRKNAHYIFLAGVFIFISIFFLEDTAVFTRLQSASDSVYVLYRLGFESIDQMTYGDMYSLIGSTDLSLFFRLKHWNEIVFLMSEASLIEKLFGSGVGATVVNTTAGLVPHNDYLRVLYECGILAFLGFIWFQFNILKGIGRNYLLVPFLVISVYMLSENLVDNYLAMMIYYFSAGFVFRRSGDLLQISTRNYRSV